MIRVAYQGTSGSFSEEAILHALGEGVSRQGCRTFESVVECVESGEVELALMPVENTLAGTVHQSFDALAEARLTIFGEVVTPIRHFVLGLPGAEFETLRSVRSHPVALAQCAAFFHQNPHVEAVVTYDTAGASDEILAMGDPSAAAISPLGNAERCGLTVLVPDVQDRADNQTRFLIVGRADSPEPTFALSKTIDRAVISAEIPNRPGALARMLTMIAEAGHDLTRIDGKPAGTPWTYRFVLELSLAGGLDDPGRTLTMEGPEWQLRVDGVFPRYA